MEKMILEFDAVDSSGFRFRYHGETFGTYDPLRDILRVNELHIRYDVLFAQMDHVRRVLGMIDTYLYESHGTNRRLCHRTSASMVSFLRRSPREEVRF